MYRLVRCGDPRYGLSLLHCPDCKIHMAVPYSCKTRVCPSCVNRRAEVLAHSLAETRSGSPTVANTLWAIGTRASLLGQLRHSILKSLVARKCLQLESARLLESWPLERSGLSAFVGDAINQLTDRPRLERVLNYIFRPSMPLKHLSYVESTGQVRFLPPGPPAFEH